MVKIIGAALATMPGGFIRQNVVRITFETGPDVDVCAVGVRAVDVDAATRGIVEGLQELIARPEVARDGGREETPRDSDALPRQGAGAAGGE